MNRNGSVSIVAVLLIVAAVAAAGWFLLRSEEEAPVTTPETPVEEVQDDDRGPNQEDTREPRKITDVVENNPGGQQGNAPPPTGKFGVPTELAGFVYDADGHPIPGATVQIIHYDFDRSSKKRIHERFIERIVKHTATAEDGSWKFEKLTPSTKHYIRASAPDYIEQIKDNVTVGLLVNFSLRKGARVSGTVVDEATGQPVPGTKVRGWYKTAQSIRDVNKIYRWQRTVLTKDDGTFSFDGVPAATVKFMLYHDEYIDFNQDEVVKPGVQNRFDFKITRGVVIEGIVLDKLHDKPVPNAEVQVTDIFVPKVSTTTDENGRFRVTGLKPGTQIFSFRADGYTPLRQPTEIAESDTYVESKNNLMQFYIDPAGRAAGIVRDPDGNPIANARVFVARQNPLMKQVRGKAEFRTGPDGQFLVQNLGTDADFVIAAHVPGYGIGVSEAFRVGPEELRDDITVRLSRGAAISGVVRDENDVPIAGARVAVEIPPFADVWFAPNFDLGQPTTKTVVTGDDGRYEVTGVWKGAFNFNVTHPKHVALDKQRVTIKETDEHVQHDFKMQIGRYLAGTCRDIDGSAAEGAMITVTRPWSGKIEARASVDQDGNWRIDGLVKGEYRVQARKQGYSSEAFDDIPADSDNLHFTLRENGNLIGSVTAPDGTPVTRFSVSLLPVHDGTPAAIQRSMRLAKPARAFADEGGNFHWADIDPGHYNVTVRTQNYPDWTEDNVHIPSGSAGSITVRMKAGGAIVGRVIDPNGNGLVDAIITARPKLDRSNPSAIGRAKALATQFEGKGEGVDGAGGGKLTTRPTPDGSYAIRGLEPGEYTLHIQSTRYVAPPVEAVVVAEEQETRRDFTMGLAGQLTVTVTDDFNDPVVGAAVIIRDPATGRKPLSVRGGPRTDQRGSVTLTGVPSGTFKITVNRSGYMIKEINVNVAAGAEMSESVQIEKIR